MNKCQRLRPSVLERRFKTEKTDITLTSTMWPGGEWRAPNASTPDKNNLAWQPVNLAIT